VESPGRLPRQTGGTATYLATAECYQMSWKEIDMLCLSASARCNQTRRWSMKVAKAIDLYLDYHRLNSQKKYEPHLWVHPFKVPRPIF
jgi:hypothetical protein